MTPEPRRHKNFAAPLVQARHSKYGSALMRRDAGVVERGGLENR